MNKAVKTDLLTAFNSSSLTGTYQPINPLGFSGPAVLIRLINNSSVDVNISYDGSYARDFLPKGTSLTLDIAACSVYPDFVTMFAKGTKVYVSGSAGTGNIYLAVYHL
jgi:hypothetical protein